MAGKFWRMHFTQQSFVGTTLAVMFSVLLASCGEPATVQVSPVDAPTEQYEGPSTRSGERVSVMVDGLSFSYRSDAVPTDMAKISQENRTIEAVRAHKGKGGPSIESIGTIGEKAVILFGASSTADSNRKSQLQVEFSSLPHGTTVADQREELHDEERIAGLERAGYDRSTIEIQQDVSAELLTHESSGEVILRWWSSAGSVYLRSEGLPVEAIMRLAQSMEVGR